MSYQPWALFPVSLDLLIFYFSLLSFFATQSVSFRGEWLNTLTDSAETKAGKCLLKRFKAVLQPIPSYTMPSPLYVAPLYHNEGYLDG
jgi:hypothetical protein